MKCLSRYIDPARNERERSHTILQSFKPYRDPISHCVQNFAKKEFLPYLIRRLNKLKLEIVC
jgi:hypothetical protein